MQLARRSAIALLLSALVGCTGSDGGSPAVSSSPRDTITGRPPAQTATPPGVSTQRSPGRSQEPSGSVASDVPSRVVIEALGIDLPIVSGDLLVPGNPPDYPLCDVAQYLTTYRHPGRLGTTTWIYGHARTGMFLPLLEASMRNDGIDLIGTTVDVYSTASRVYRYRVTGVHPHQVDRSVARDVAPDEGRLVLQTSEGPRGTVPKLQVSAMLVDIAAAAAGDALPSPAPRECDG